MASLSGKVGRARLQRGEGWRYEFDRWGFYAFWASIVILTVFLGYFPQFVLLWVVPYLTSFHIIGWFIEMSEHCSSIDNQNVNLHMARNRQSRHIEKWLTGINNDNYHLDHHRMPSAFDRIHGTTMNRRFSSPILGATFAFLAALSNGTVGVLSRTAFNEGLDYTAIAFWRCAVALSLVSFVVLWRTEGGARLTAAFAGSWRIAICSALGIFTLYHFETRAFAYASIPLVAILVFAGGLGAIALDILILKERVTVRKALATFMVFLGGFSLIAGDGLATGSMVGVTFALIAGLGYASFIFAWKFLKLRSSLENSWWFLAYGVLMLFVPYVWKGAQIPSMHALPILLSLGIIPSLCRFYCTILALQHIEAYKTQVIESSEPFFSALFAALFFSEWLTGKGMAAALVIIAGALITSMPERRSASAQLHSVAGDDQS